MLLLCLSFLAPCFGAKLRSCSCLGCCLLLLGCRWRQLHLPHSLAAAVRLSHAASCAHCKSAVAARFSLNLACACSCDVAPVASFFIARLLPAILSCSVFFKPSYTTPFERSGHVARKNYGESLLGPRLFVCSFSFALTSPGSCLWSGCRRKRLLPS